MQFGLFNCKQIGGKLYFMQDLELDCYEGLHLFMVLLLGISQILLYVVTLPMVVFYILRRNRSNLSSHVTTARYGLFYSAYKEQRYFWEMILTMRKISVVSLLVFGPYFGVEVQTQIVLLLLLICIVLCLLKDLFMRVLEVGGRGGI